MTERMQVSEHEIVDGLLPWFVNDTLNQAESERVRRHLEDCEDCRANVSLLSLAQSTVRRTTATPIVPPPRVDELLATIDRSEYRKRLPRWVMTTTIAAASLAVVALSVSLFVASRQSIVTPTRFETATSPARQASIDYVLNVRFEPATQLVDRQRVFRELEAKDINPGEIDGMYRITVSLPATSLTELEQYVRDVEKLPEIRSASVVALQLPMRPQQ